MLFHLTKEKELFARFAQFRFRFEYSRRYPFLSIPRFVFPNDFSLALP